MTRRTPATTFSRIATPHMYMAPNARYQRENIHSLKAKVTLEPPSTEEATEAQKDVNADLPPGYRYYETMLVVQPKLNEMEKDVQLGYFERILGKNKAINVL